MTVGDITLDQNRWSRREWVQGSLLTWDFEAMAGYLTICPDPNRGLVDGAPHGGCCHRAGPTVEIGDGINVDTDAEGRILGIEVLGHPLSIGDLVKVFRWLLADGGDSVNGESDG